MNKIFAAPVGRVAAVARVLRVLRVFGHWRLCISALSIFVSLAAHAAFSPPTLGYVVLRVYQPMSGQFPTIRAACDAALPIAKTWTAGSFPEGASWSETWCFLHDAWGVGWEISPTAPFAATRAELGIREVRDTCPANSTPVGAQCQCNEGFQEDPSHASCVAVAPPPSQMCTAGGTAGHPILPATGEKYRLEHDFADAGPAALRFTRTYRSSWRTDPTRLSSPLGIGWAHDHDYLFSPPSPDAPNAATITLPDGYRVAFSQTGGTGVWRAGNSADTLTPQGADWLWRQAQDDATYRFDAAGKLRSRTERNGWTTLYAHDGAGRLSTITNPFGRTLTLAYNGQGQLSSVTTPDARVVGYGYDRGGRLISVAYPDGKTRRFFYEESMFPQALTGIADETGARWATFTYDAQGRAIGTELAAAADRYQVSYAGAGSATVTDPLGTSRRFSYGTANGVFAVRGGSLPSGTGERDAATRTQDANGLITSETDFKGVVTTTTWDTVRRLPLSVTRAAGTPQAQTTTTQWHPTFALPTLVTEAGRTVATTYDDKGNVLTEVITDTASSPNATQTRSWTWNAQGLAATETAPGGGVTRFSYDPRGNLVKATNALGHDTLYAYDSANRVVSQTSPSGLVTTFTYDARDRLLTRTVGSLPPTTFTYKPTGLLDTLTLPGGLSISYTYDAAHRLTGWSNNRGESGVFTLDAMGNRVAEQVKNSTGAIAWSTARSINSLNRVASRTDGSNQTNTFGYDPNGERVSDTNGLNQSTRYGLDPLRRVSSITNAANATAGLSYNALDAVTQANDFKGVATNYSRNAQGSATAETSPDIGAKAIQYDVLGLPAKITDAMGQATQIQRDAIGRPTLITYADGKTTNLVYDGPNSKGYLTSFTDRSGTTTYTRDTYARVVTRTQVLANGMRQQTGYSYTAAGQLATVGYPNGDTLSHVYDATGRLIQLNRNGTPLITGLAWNPMGQPTEWRWAFAGNLPASRTYDTAARLTATEFASYVYDAAGRITSLTQNLFQPGDTDPNHSSIANANTTWGVSYDPVGRITGFTATGSQTTFSYDANGNRTASTKTANGQSTTRNYTVAGSSNRIEGFTQTTGGTTTAITYGHNANGDLTTDGLRTYTYDAENRLSAVTTGASDTSPTTRYAHNALGQRVFKTEPLYPPSEGDEQDQSFFQGLVSFFTKRWGPNANEAEKQGYAYVYDEEGNLLAETGTGGANSTGSTQYIYLPTANGPMPIAVVIDGEVFAVHSDHLNTPRRLTTSQGQPVRQWAYSAFGDEKPTVAKYRFANLESNPNPGTTNISEVIFNKRYDGHYFDKESGLNYNVKRSYNSALGRYTQPDPIGLNGGSNRDTYANLNPLKYTDPNGLVAQAIGPAAPVLAVGCALTQGCRQALIEAARNCGRGIAKIKDWIFSDGANKPTSPADVLAPNGQPVGHVEGSATPDVRTVTSNELDDIVDDLKGLGAKPGSRGRYTGDWYDLPNGQGGFGVRESRHNGRTIDVNVPGVPDVTKIHQRP